jgi:calcineurin-like phosphoesterase family protein
MSKVFVASDTHFGHANIIKYTKRPFKSAGHQDAELIRRWNERVDVDDTVYFLGDFAMGRGVDAAFVAVKLAQLNGNIKIVLGNHDLPCKWSDGLEAFLREHPNPKVEILGKDAQEISHDGKKFLLYHYPIVDWDGRFKGVIHLHGHCHGRVTTGQRPVPTGPDDIAKTYDTPNGRWLTSIVAPEKGRYDVGVDCYGGPVELTGDLRYLNNPKGWE